MKYLIFALSIFSCGTSHTTDPKPGSAEPATVASMPTDTIVPAQFDPSGKLITITKTDAEWKKLLTEQEYYVLRQKGTERAFTGDLVNNHEKGVFICAACGLPLFSSTTKFESGTGWPSFYQPITPESVGKNKDSSYGMDRDEVLCARCGGHLGHVFDDGPRPTGLRYCMNSVSLDFVKQ
jgi:peptide-methionine (R)-S-oxide reductase